MKRTSLFITTAVVALMAATSASVAQHENTPQRERSAPAEKIAPQNPPAAHNQAPNGRAGEAMPNHGRTETTGQAPREERQGRPGDRNLEQEHGRTETPQRSERKERDRMTGQAPREERSNRGSDQDHPTAQAPREDRTNRSSEQNRFEQERERANRAEGNRTTTGQGAAGTRAYNLTPESRTRIHEVIVHERSAPRVNSPNFNVAIGTRVPRTVPFVALPETIVQIEPAWRGFEYFLIGDQMVIVDPRSMEIVAIVDA